METLDVVKDIEVDDLEGGSPVPRKFRVGLGIILVLLVVSYIVVSFPVGNILRGQIESRPLLNEKIQLKNFSIMFEKDTEKIVESYYLNERRVEFSLCLSGRKEKGEYIIDIVYQPRQIEQSFNHVTFEPCKENDLIILHTHPYKSCLASQTDLNTLEKSKEKNQDVLMVVMCEIDRFSVYS
jgi:proteasome lid subunit RPN8/RPN11